MDTTAIVLGGIGLFLLGMILMTEGLKEIAGDSMRNLLSKFTGGLPTSIATGTILTAIIQSSSATMLMTIGFVSAGLLTFTQSIGVVFGANLGSSSIGWIVSFIGLKVSISAFALPLIGIGALWRFLLNSKKAAYGTILAGFGLIFLGIGTLQEGMTSVAESFSFSGFSEANFLHQLALLGIGLVMTVIMQSSSTALVITLTALAAQAVSFEQAALLVIGQNIGTTVKAFFVTIGGTVAAKRTAMAHILFNIFAGFFAFLGLPLWIRLIKWIGENYLQNDAAVMLALFSTFFYLLGIVGILPVLNYFIVLIERIIPEKGNKITKYLDKSVTSVPPVAIEAMRRTLIRVLRTLTEVGEEIFTTQQMTPTLENTLAEVKQALQETRQFASDLGSNSIQQGSTTYYQQIALIHAIDHLERLTDALGEADGPAAIQQNQATRELAQTMRELFHSLQHLSYESEKEHVEQVQKQSQNIASIRRVNREEIFEKTVRRQSDVDLAVEKVHTLHWIDRVAYHIWRSMHHLENCLQAEQSIQS